MDGPTTSARHAFTSLEVADGVPGPLLDAIADEFTLVRLGAGDPLFQAGDDPECLFWVLEGRLAVTRTDDTGDTTLVGEVGRGEPVGERALLREAKRSADVTAIRSTTLVRLSSGGFERLLDGHAPLRTRLAQLVQAREAAPPARLYRPPLEELLGFLRTTTLLGSLSDGELRAFEDELTWVSLPSGALLMKRGDPGDCLYLVVSGRLRVFSEESGVERSVGEVAQGECVGEMSLLTDEPRTATVRAARDTETVRLSKSGFERLWREHPETTRRLARLIVQRLRQSWSGKASTDSVTTIGVVPLSPNVPLAAFCEAVAQHLGAPGEVLHLSAARLDALLRPGSSRVRLDEPANHRVVEWLNAQEATHKLILYEGDLAATAWTQRCLRQADRILLVGLAGETPSPGEMEFELEAMRDAHVLPRCELVLLHERDENLSTTSALVPTRRWLASREVLAHHHVRLGNVGDHARLARLLSGRALGLVLGGGGARGFAHIGVLRALREAGLTPDVIGGTSMGAMIGALHALGRSDQEIFELSRENWVRLKPLNDYTIPMVSMIRGAKVERMLKTTFGGARIEDLWLKYFAVSSNLTRATVHVHSEGELWQAVRASISIPGIGPPAFSGGDLHVDGAILNNLPADVMRRYCKGKVIVVDVSAENVLALPEGVREFPSGWELLLRKLGIRAHRVGPRVPGLFDILFRTAMLASRAQSAAARHDADLLLQPPLGEYGLLQFGAIEAIVEAGHQYAERRLDEWRSGGFTLG